MDIGIITELIATLGFPIALVIAMAYFIYKIYNQSVAREEKLMEEIKANREINSQAIETIAHYSEKLETIQTDISEIKTELTIIASK